MKRTIVLGLLLSGLAALTIACGEPPDTLTNESADSKGTIAGDEDNEDKTTEQDNSDPAPVSTTSAKDTPAKTTPPKTNADACNPDEAETAAECAKCCAEQAAPTAPPAGGDDCACGAGGACADACSGTSVCGGEGFNLECGLCMFQEKCVPGAGNLGNLGNGGGDAAACFQKCEDKP